MWKCGIAELATTGCSRCVAGSPRTFPVMTFDSTRTCWLNGSFVPERDAKVSIFDRGLLFGDGVYEVAAALDGRLLDADLHLARLTRSLGAIQIEGTLSTAAWLEVMQQLLDRNGIEEGFVYLEVTRGVADRDFPFPAHVVPLCSAQKVSGRSQCVRHCVAVGARHSLGAAGHQERGAAGASAGETGRACGGRVRGTDA